MDERIEAFLLDVLADEGKHFNVVRANTRCYLALYVEMFRAREVQEYKKDAAAPAMSRLVSPARAGRT
jgi:hypothetical protein